MRLGKSVFPKTLYLIVDLQGEAFRVSSVRYARDQFVPERFQATLPLPGGHGAAQLVSLATTEARRNDRKLHHLLLKDGHAQGALEHLFETLFVGDAGRVAAILQIGMHHIALNGAGRSE